MNKNESPRNAMKRASEVRKKRAIPCEVSDDERGGAIGMQRAWEAAQRDRSSWYPRPKDGRSALIDPAAKRQGVQP